MKTKRNFTSPLVIALAIAGLQLLPSCNDETALQAQTVVGANFIPQPDPTPQSNKKIKLAILLDTSNSMDGLIDQAKAQLWSIVQELSKAKCDNLSPVLEIAVYQYGNNGLSPAEGYIQQVQTLTTDLDAVSAKLFSLRTNGGDEFCGYAINTALDQLAWNESPDDLKIIFIAGNEPFNQGPKNFIPICQRAKAMDVVVNTIYCGDFNAGISEFWREGASITGGEYSAINHNSKTVYINTPFDQKISALNTSLNGTYVYYGSQGSSKLGNMIAQDENAASYSQSNFASRVAVKSSAVYKAKDWDLVEAAKEKDFKFDAALKETLPDTLRKKSEAEILKLVEEQDKKRKAIQAEIQALNVQREKFIAEQKQATGEKSLDDAIIAAIHKQAAAKRIEFEGKK